MVQEKLKMDTKRNDYSNTEVCEIINEYIHSERDRAILKRRLVDGICYEPLAEEFDLSVKQIKNIVYKNEIIIFDKLGKDLII